MMKKKCKGFLLVEALVALVIIAVAVSAALVGIGNALKLTGRSESFTEVVLPLENLLFDLETGYREDLLESGGETVVEGHRFRLEFERITPETAEEAPEVPEVPETEDFPGAGKIQVFQRLNITAPDPGQKDLFNTELFLGQEMFS